MVLTEDMAQTLVGLAGDAGFDLAGFTDLVLDDADRQGLEAFVARRHHGEMTWFARHQALRLDPGRLLRREESTPEADLPGVAMAPGVVGRSALVLGMVYFDGEYDRRLRSAPYRVARYAAGRDYHRVLKKHAAPIVSWLESQGIEARLCVDSVPLPEKVLARNARLGWRGKNTNLIHPDLGSWFVLGVILVDRELAFAPGERLRARPTTDLCGDCRLCLDACPTGALYEAYRIDARRCLSYLTIEAESDRRAFPAQRHRQVFGCDICQEVCPHNRPRTDRPVQRRVHDFAPRSAVVSLLEEYPDEAAWAALAGTALRRVSLAELHENFALADSDRAPGPRGAFGSSAGASEPAMEGGPA